MMFGQETSQMISKAIQEYTNIDTNISVADDVLEELKIRAIESVSDDMRRNTSPIKNELDMLLLEAMNGALNTK